jgi:hypothetical protein
MLLFIPQALLASTSVVFNCYFLLVCQYALLSSGDNIYHFIFCQFNVL